jgi:hypothetical protein
VARADSAEPKRLPGEVHSSRGSFGVVVLRPDLERTRREMPVL